LREGLIAHTPAIASADWEGRSPLEVCKELLLEFRIPPDMYQVGRTKLFFRAGVLGHLEDTSARINRCARLVPWLDPGSHVQE
jgi:myosin heavy subunit